MLDNPTALLGELAVLLLIISYDNCPQPYIGVLTVDFGYSALFLSILYE